MSQQEFEPRRQQPDEEVYQPQYPYAWSDQPQQEGMPRDEPPINYDRQAGYQAGQSQVPWWARPQPQQNDPFRFAAIVGIAILVILLMGALGIAGVVLGALGHILGVILGAILALLIFVFLLVFLILGLIFRAIGRSFGVPGLSSRRMARRTAHDYRRMARRAARRAWRDPW
jgi:hypothetical protein